MAAVAPGAPRVARIRARWAWLEPHTSIGPVEVVVAGGRIARIGRARGPVPPVALLPGLVNAHVHLDLAPLERATRRFVPWVRAVLRGRAADAPADPAERIGAALVELLQDGVTAVGEVDGTGASPAVLRGVPVAGRCYRELTGFHLDARGAARLLQQRPARGSRACPGGWSPHAPYSVSPALFRAAARTGRPLMVHVAETVEEQEFLHAGRGPFRALLEELGRLPAGFRPPGAGAVEVLRRCGLLRPDVALVHCQHLEPDDAGRIAAGGNTVVVCPGTVEFFGRPAPPVPAWLAGGIPVALGTDSRASNTALSMRCELARAARAWPALPPAQLLAMATVHGARALARAGLGRIRVGGRADLLLVDATAADPAALLTAFVHGDLAVRQRWLQGRPWPA